jgi:hypothetical protein
MLYDVRSFLPNFRAGDRHIAADPQFMEALEGAGAHVRVIEMEPSQP